MSNKLINAINKLEPAPELKEKIYDKIFNDRPPKSKKVLVTVSSAAAILCTVFLVYIYFTVSKQIPSITIPNPEINISPLSDAPLFFIYNHKCYKSALSVEYDMVKELLDRELGETQYNGLDLQRETIRNSEIITLPDFTSNSPNMKIYSLKGCDKNFRLIAIYEGFDSKKYAKIYDSPYELTIRSGKDFFEKFTIGKIFSAEYYNTNRDEITSQIKNSKLSSISQAKLNILDNFISSLDNAKPYEFFEGTSLSPKYTQNYKTIIIHAENSIDIYLNLWKIGDECFVAYGGGYYKMIFIADKESFNNLWDIIV